MSKFLSALIATLFLCGCHRGSDDTHPKLSYAVQDRYLRSLPSPFTPLTPTERLQDWGKEYIIAMGFAHQLDLYPAMNGFKRALFLLPSDQTERKLELEYNIFLCYYFGQKYIDAIYTFEQGPLRTVTPQFPAYRDLLVILYDCYIETDAEEKAQNMLSYIQQNYPELGTNLSYSGLLIQGDIPALDALDPKTPPLENLLTQYHSQAKSPTTAKTLNAFIPGAGYFYLGQPQSAFTAMLLNGLFIWGSVYAYQHHQLPLGIILTSFEAGWYFGGIYGAGVETKHYNERVYERLATPMMNRERLFPILMLKYAF
ncbi:MAG: tetratricopeptide repeat protein [Verrucomicrobia bacterium]|nr:tetratricopeptide repeat protein [Verrucomicrobiota bacterium]